jgi:hypothetical protein
MVVTPPNDMVWLSPDELRSMGVTMVGKPSQTAQDATLPPIDPAQVARQPPQQTKPSDPVSLSPSAKSSKPITWEDLVSHAVALSAQQNGGKAKTIRACQPEFKTCYNAVILTLDGTETVLKVTRDMTDKIIRKEVCSFYSSGDIRVCEDWDSRRKHRDMQDAQGNWSKVADE